MDTETKHALDSGDDLSLIFFDLDRFKEVNDTHGHLVGSRVLKEIATLIEEVFVDSGSAAARYGGDEYVILIPGYSLEQSHDYGERLRETIEKNVFISEGLAPGEPPLNVEGLITCSMGIASLQKANGRGASEMKDALIRAADGAKDLGKNRVSLDTELETSS